MVIPIFLDYHKFYTYSGYNIIAEGEIPKLIFMVI